MSNTGFSAIAAGVCVFTFVCVWVVEKDLNRTPEEKARAEHAWDVAHHVRSKMTKAEQEADDYELFGGADGAKLRAHPYTLSDADRHALAEGKRDRSTLGLKW
jgi:hypothetical protein